MDSDESDSSSAPCLASCLVGGHVIDPATVRDVARFRKSERARLYELRKAVPVDRARKMANAVSSGLVQTVPQIAGTCIAVYWPIRGELDLRDWMSSLNHHGMIVALPVVVEVDQPVEFHRWTPGSRMKRGIWSIPVPENVEKVQPDIVVAPLLGVDENRFRLGNGGGYYDRTLANMASDARFIGVGHKFCMMKTIFPMPWDIPMHSVILSDGTIC